jgi:hypothetical protein
MPTNWRLSVAGARALLGAGTWSRDNCASLAPNNNFSGCKPQRI